jgi:hypothetical protein
MITAENYINYFMLYVDDELSTTEREMVLAFANSNAEYKEMLAALLQTKLELPAVTNVQKNSLLKPTVVAVHNINEENYNYYFTASIDNALTKEEAADLDDFLYKNPSLETEYDWIEKTKLPEEHIVYHNKQRLLKKEGWLRIIDYISVSVAAASLLIGFFSLFSPSENKPTGSNVTANMPKGSTIEIFQKQEQQENKPANSNKATENAVGKAKANLAKTSVLEGIQPNKNTASNKVAMPNTLDNKSTKKIFEVVKDNFSKENSNIYVSNNVKRIDNVYTIETVRRNNNSADIIRTSYNGTAEITVATVSNNNVNQPQENTRGNIKRKLFNKAKAFVKKLKTEDDEKVNIGPLFVDL